MNLWKYVSIRKDVFDEALDEKVAPSLSDVVFGKTHKAYMDPEEFINITYVTSTIKKIVKEVINSFITSTGKIIMLPSAYGGGKTHIMILLYHLTRKPSLLSRVLGEQEKHLQHVLEDVTVIVIDGTDKRTAPSPLPDETLEEGDAKIKTLWGYIAYRLNLYDKIRMYDEMLISPEKVKLSEMFLGKKVLILIDELGIYYNRLKKVPAEIADKLRGYPDQIVIFLRTLSEIVKDNNIVVILSIPAEVTESGFESEPGYEEFIMKIEHEVARMAIRAEKPIASSEDFVNILKKRLFENINSEGIRLVVKKLKDLYRDYNKLVKDIGAEVDYYYPFHPLFITTLRDIVERNKKLQKTRDALRIARKVVRNLYGKQELSLIMPTDIDLKMEEIRILILTGKFLSFDAIIDKIISKVKEIPVEEGINHEVYRDLAYRLVLYVFLRTFIYDPHLEPRSEFPAKNEIITGIYDPARYEQYFISPTMASDLLDKLSSGNIEYRVPHFYGKDGYYWVTRLLDIGELIEKEAERVEDLTAKNKVIEEIEKLYRRSYDGGEEVKPKVFSLKPIIIPEPKLIEHDVPEYKLVIVTSPVKDLKEGTNTSGNIYDIIYYRPLGRQKTLRKYANTIVVLLSNNEDKWKEVIKIAKRIIATKKLEKNIKDEYKHMGENVIKILKGELDNMSKDLTNSLKFKLVAQYFNLIAYPYVKENKNVIEVKRVNPTMKTLVELAEETLKDENKIIEKKYSEQFDVIARILEPDQKITWSKTMKVSDITSAFYENPELPMIPAEHVKIALLSGLKELKIGVIKEGNVYFKKIEGVAELSELNDTDVIIPAKDAVERQIGVLSREEEKEEGSTIIRHYYVAIYGKEEIPIKNLKLKYPDNYIDVFLNSDIKLHEEIIRRDFDVEIEPKELELKFDEVPEQIFINVLVKSIGKFEDMVILKSESEGCKVEPSSGIPNYKATWLIPVPKEQGKYTYSLRAEGGKISKSVEFKLTIIKGKFRSPEPLGKISEIILRGETDAVAVVKYLKVVSKSVLGSKIIKQCNLKVEFYDKMTLDGLEKFIQVDLKNVRIDDVEMVVKGLSSVFGQMAKLKCFGEIKLEIKGEGKVVDINSLSSVHREIKQSNIDVEYIC
jgi:predicted AAA+ superfamily ATPase